MTGILNEILVDRKLRGEPLPQNIIPIAAANPYKLRKKQKRSLTNGLKLGGIKS